MRRLIWAIVAVLFLTIANWYLLSKASPTTPQPQQTMTLTITSPAFEMNGKIPERFTCDGKNISPELIFSNIPASAQSLALTIEDPDVPHSIRADGMWNHWVVWNMPPTTARIEEGVAPLGVVGMNTSGKVAYGGPCPPDFPLVSPETLGNRSALDSSWPPDREHRYIFTLYALDMMLSLPPGSTKEKLLQAIAPHLIEKATLIGRYNRN